MSDRLDERTLRRIATRFLRDPADRDDVVQEARLAEILTHVAPVDRARWLSEVIRLRCQRVWERRRRREDAYLLLDPPAAPPDPAEAVDRILVREWLHACVDQLGEPLRETVLARFFEGLALQEIAERTGRPLGTVKTHLRTGLRELRREMDRPSRERS